jgi:hypothetical protein
MDIVVFRGLRKEHRMGMYENRGMEHVWTVEEVTCYGGGKGCITNSCISQ